MPSTLDHPSSKSLLGEVQLLFKTKRVFYALGTHVSFVCGGSKKTHLRTRYISHLKNGRRALEPFRAEDALSDLFSDHEPQFVNLVDLEELIAGAFDSVLVFPESPGSFVELGFFSHSDIIRKKTLVASLDTHQDDSFLVLGPLASINRDSAFSPNVIISAKKISTGFGAISRRLLRYTSKRRHRIPFTYTTYSRMVSRDKLFVLAELVLIFGVIDVDDLETCVRRAFGKVVHSEFRWLVSMLVAADIISRHQSNSNYLVAGSKGRRFLEFEHGDISRLQARIAQFYRKRSPECYALLGGAS
jgi:hypothetical protein